MTNEVTSKSFHESCAYEYGMAVVCALQSPLPYSKSLCRTLQSLAQRAAKHGIVALQADSKLDHSTCRG